MTGSVLASKILHAALIDSGYAANQADKKLVAELVRHCDSSIKSKEKWSKKDIEDFACGELSDQKRVAATKSYGILIDRTLSEIMDSMP